MKQRYIREVNRRLTVSRSLRQDILRDLQEAFADALENGESEAELIERLGSPAAFVANIHAELGISSRDRVIKRRKKFQIAFAALAISALLSNFILWMQRIPSGVIGQGSALTGIRVPGVLPVIQLLLLIFGAAFLFLAVFGAIHRPRNERK